MNTIREIRKIKNGFIIVYWGFGGEKEEYCKDTNEVACFIVEYFKD